MNWEETVVFEVKTLNGLFMRSEMACMEEMGCGGLSYMNGWIIGFLHANRDREIFQKDIEAEFSVARSTVTNLVKQMEKGGYITRVGVERDSRLKRLELTEKGEECHKRIQENFFHIEEMISEGIEPEQKEIFINVAKQIRRNLSRHMDNGTAPFPFRKQKSCGEL